MQTLFRSTVLKLLPAVLTQRVQFRLKEPSRQREIQWTGDETMDRLLATIARDGFVVIPDYLSPDACRAAIADFERAAAAHPECVWREEDDRMFRLEAVSAVSARFRDDPLWIALYEAYCGEPCTSLFIMGNRVDRREGVTNGSGGSWHRDCFARELKALVYLNDVDEENGPFQVLPGSHTTDAILRDIKTTGLRAIQIRFNDAQTARLLETYRARHVRVTAPAGTAIVFDTSSLHCGAPIIAGVRYALTNYLQVARRTTPELFAYYDPMIPT